MFNLGTAIVTALSLLMAGVANGAPAEAASMADINPVTLYQDMEYNGNSQELREAGVCYPFPENTPWFHNISSMNIRPGYICDAYMGFACNQMLKAEMQGEHRNLENENVNNMIESMKCRPN
ncbi:hypothetical protein F9C07_2281037 [Aspergillus flavus]|uniref:Uncharacterized protein n=1 Tax=Aspergillus flavus (strain ATCC 200026 / FGSC A1120 / IAM 13836 / NRRL 3357 / JCM 12722 / SRRC 167) TaxID=332952 RepID=A0A7G5KI01_ASPFN|nr:uncharacterized protein G4B84_010922 [Aspergillus flavus NRRL3357]KAJ1712731.1 hypothetical protein NYO67_5077 [Aspergillus flavus]KAF7624444.1 hypothetical protein AFLA_008150 [Aspergillus flavus NRRL3357]QMW35431.1 hypothetical protein G4B84_010922 [Aspergillus flavus NRRL3357]QMW47493.1 hypothetical protein G4B11_010972 [Aspergillus flavus]QRD91850.1 hypothetical protein F9C07_2281037 [Aspergillus flavus]